MLYRLKNCHHIWIFIYILFSLHAAIRLGFSIYFKLFIFPHISLWGLKVYLPFNKYKLAKNVSFFRVAVFVIMCRRVYGLPDQIGKNVTEGFVMPFWLWKPRLRKDFQGLHRQVTERKVHPVLNVINRINNHSTFSCTDFQVLYSSGPVVQYLLVHIILFWNIITSNCFISEYILNFTLLLWGKAEFSVSLLQS